jgi:hypothetical protein
MYSHPVYLSNLCHCFLKIITHKEKKYKVNPSGNNRKSSSELCCYVYAEVQKIPVLIQFGNYYNYYFPKHLKIRHLVVSDI